MKKQVTEIIRQKMVDYINEREESVRWLSKKVGLPYSSVYRFISRESHGCSFRTAYQILKVICPAEESRAILLEHFPAFAELINTDLRHVEEHEEEAKKSHDLILKSRTHYLIFCLVRGGGCNRSEIKDRFGRVGENILEEFVAAGTIKQASSGKLKATVAVDLGHNQTAAQFHAESLDLSDEYTLLENGVDGLNNAGLDAIRWIIAEAKKQIDVVRADPSKRGESVFFMSLVSGRLAGESLGQKQSCVAV
jgi:hypothetical protein